MPYTPTRYTPGPGYAASKANQRIYNFKANTRAPKSRGRLYYIQHSRLEFAKDLKPAIEALASRSPDETVSVMFVPTSKRTDDPEYNDAFETACEHLKRMLGTKIVIEKPVETIESRESSSLVGGSRGVQFIEGLKANLKWSGFRRPPKTLIIFDDVIKTGAHFTALKELVITNTLESPEIVGLFWALSQEPADTSQPCDTQ